MKKYRYTHTDGSQEIITTRFTNKELSMMVKAVERYDDICYNEEGKTGTDEIRKAVDIILAKANLKGIPQFDESKYDDFYFDD